jgi:hypothetical protein
VFALFDGLEIPMLTKMPLSNAYRMWGLSKGRNYF